MKSVRCRRVCLAAALLLAASSAGAQSLGDVAQRAKQQRNATDSPSLKLDDRDVNPRLAAQEVLEYEVTAERWRHFQAADIWVDRALERDSALMQRMMALRADTARALERFLAREPVLAKALASAGSDPHEYAFTQVAITVGLLLNQNDKAVANKDQLPAATQANMAFVKAHDQELRDMQARALVLKAQMEK